MGCCGRLAWHDCTMDVRLTAFVIYQDAAKRQIDHKNVANYMRGRNCKTVRLRALRIIRFFGFHRLVIFSR